MRQKTGIHSRPAPLYLWITDLGNFGASAATVKLPAMVAAKVPGTQGQRSAPNSYHMNHMLIETKHGSSHLHISDPLGWMYPEANNSLCLWMLCLCNSRRVHKHRRRHTFRKGSKPVAARIFEDRPLAPVPPERRVRYVPLPCP